MLHEGEEKEKEKEWEEERKEEVLEEWSVQRQKKDKCDTLPDSQSGNYYYSAWPHDLPCLRRLHSPGI